jgi:hypothetical protein
MQPSMNAIASSIPKGRPRLRRRSCEAVGQKKKMADHKKAHTVTPSSNDALDEEFLTEKQFARRHRRSPKILRNDRVLGRGVPFHSFGRQVRYRLSDMIAYEQAHRVDPNIGTSVVSSVDPRADTFLTPARETSSARGEDASERPRSTTLYLVLQARRPGALRAFGCPRVRALRIE